jgi:hypothetical protein
MLQTKICAQCGQPFSRDEPPTHFVRRRFCSIQCAGAVTRLSLREAFEAKVDRSGGPDACWPWRGALDKDGYGHFTRYYSDKTYKSYRATHLALEFANKPLAPRQLALHTCDNVSCCNPAHLYGGTHRQNMADMVQQGRLVDGVWSPAAKLTAFEVKRMRKVREQGMS